MGYDTNIFTKHEIEIKQQLTRLKPFTCHCLPEPNGYDMIVHYSYIMGSRRFKDKNRVSRNLIGYHETSKLIAHTLLIQHDGLWELYIRDKDNFIFMYGAMNLPERANFWRGFLATYSADQLTELETILANIQGKLP